jgi:hypothetical protein
VIATDRFVFLHLHKSGGSFVNEFLMACVPGAQQVGYHLPASLIPEPFAGLPVLGFTRSPWSYYVSWYAFQKRRRAPNALYRIASDNGRLDFDATIRNLLALGTDAGSAQLDALVAALPPTYQNRGLNLPGPALEAIRGSGRGFFSFLYAHIYGHIDGPGQPPRTPRRYIGRMELLRDSLLLMLESVGQPVTPPMREFVLRHPASNVSEHGAYATYYDAALRELVAQRDAEVIAAHGYRFGE